MEKWADVKGYEGWYQVSNTGMVKRVMGQEHYLKPGYNMQGRLQVTLSKNGNLRRVQIHRLVLEAFVGPAAPGTECRHLDGDCTNNNDWNLEWATHTVNMNDTVYHGTSTQGEKHPKAKLTENDVKEIRASTETERALAARYGVSQVSIHFIKTRKTWKHVP